MFTICSNVTPTLGDVKPQAMGLPKGRSHQQWH